MVSLQEKHGKKRSECRMASKDRYAIVCGRRYGFARYAKCHGMGVNNGRVAHVNKKNYCLCNLF